MDKEGGGYIILFWHTSELSTGRIEAHRVRYVPAVKAGRKGALCASHVGMQLGLEPELDAECCTIQLIASDGSTCGISFFGEEFAVPVSALDEGIVGILLGLSVGTVQTSSKADLGLPSSDADGPPSGR